MHEKDVRIGFLGTGRMATALAVGFSLDLIPEQNIVGVDPDEDSRLKFMQAVGEGCVAFPNADSAFQDIDVLILAVKPQVMATAVAQIRDRLGSDVLVISVAAGLTISSLEGMLPTETRLIRVMPNTPCLVGSGACAVSAGTHSTQTDLDTATMLLETVGIVEKLPESLLDAVTGLSGSGPAYVFQIIEALSDGGVQAGLPREVATRLAAQTVAGSGEMVLQTREHPGVLKDAVTSPGGTTIAGIHELERAGMRAALMNAVEAATKRSRELGQS